MITGLSKNLRFFDFEVFPEWWVCTFGDMPNNLVINECIKDNFKVIRSDEDNARDKLISYFKEQNICNIGYNIKGYDLIIVNAIYQGLSPKEVYKVSEIVINPEAKYNSNEHMRLSYLAYKKFTNCCYQDLFDDNLGSLKEKEMLLGLNILETSVPFNKSDLTEEEKLEVIKYNKQDVYATMFYCKEVCLPYIETKLAVGKRFNISDEICYKSTNQKLAALVLKAVKKSYSDSENEQITIPGKVKSYIYENLPLNIIERLVNSPKSFTVTMYENIVSFANGGIHSTYCGKYNVSPALYVSADDNYTLINVDAKSYYPSLMIQLNLLSRNVTKPEIFKEIFNERMAIKAKDELTKEDIQTEKALKLILNITYGASGLKYSDLYDPHMTTTICRVGQLLLASLANKIHKTIPNASIIQNNTDGILVYLPKKDLDYLRKLEQEWMNTSGIQLEEDEVNCIWQKNVNNYLMIQNSHGKQKIKNKGDWLNISSIRPGSIRLAGADAFVCSRACIEYLINGTDIVDTIVTNKNIKDFTIPCTKGPSFRGAFQLINGERVELYKANRVIATKNLSLGKIYKYKMYKGNESVHTMSDIPEHCKLINEDIEAYDFKVISKELDYMYYVTRAANMLNMRTQKEEMEWYKLVGKNILKAPEYNYGDFNI